MPRRAPETVQEIRYEYSLGPEEQGLVEELEKSLKTLNTTTTIAAVVAPVGLACLGYGIYEAGKWIGSGIANFSLGAANMIEGVYEKTPAGMIAKEVEEKTGVPISPLDFTLPGQIAKLFGWR